MRVEPLSPGLLPGRLLDLLLPPPGGHPWRLVLDGPDGSGRELLADALVAPLRERGRPVLRVRAQDFLRPASVRLEHGAQDVQARYCDWLDLDALDREVLAPLGPDGTGRYLPTFWDPTTDRATRAAYAQAPTDAVLVLDGAMLLRPGVRGDASVHLHLDPPALARRLPTEQQWELAAYALHADDARPTALADLVVRLNDPRRPALVTP